jgi:hypothetical protein
MRLSSVHVALLVSCVLGAMARADDAADARKLVEQAVEAHGGITAIAKMQTMTRSSSGKMFLLGQETPFKDELVVALPSKWRWNLDATAGGRPVQMLLILNGDNAWQGNSAGVLPMDKSRVNEIQDESQVLWLATLVPLLQAKDLQLGLVKDEVVNGRPAKGISVSRANKGDIKLYFDNQTHLLVKIARRAREAGVVIDKEYVYSDHQPVQGVMAPKRYSEWTSGRKFVDVGSIDYKFHSSIDEKYFTKP